MLALTQPAEAKIIYTKAHHVIRPSHIYQLDLNHDGLIDFAIHNRIASNGTSSPRHSVSYSIRQKRRRG